MRLYQILTMRGLAPHGYCLLWDPLLIWLHVISDAIIALSYFSIPVVLAVFLKRRRDVEFGWLVSLFAIFITACGATHVMSILVLWVPAYGAEGLIKAITAVASVLTALAMWPLLPKLIALPSPRLLQQINHDLHREAAERARMEEQLRQAQKLEAIGQLTGGIAHDFNNILAIVMGNIERATLGIDKPDRALGALANAMEASQRAAGLTEQLLAFARKQPLQVQRHDLSHIAEELVRLIALTLGEHIVLVTQLSKAPLPVDIDRQQLEAALINLAVNARDAMPDGGTLTITTDEVDQGEVLIMVSDSGTGMDSRTLERATEPFFTTKPVGRGSGLGLSQVYGFVQEAGGRLTIASAPGEGSRVTITLARGQSGAWT
ncbi:sensor histidine kinase [Novosphingobium rosa]|uniref:sensor histidine kinase n=1 Tax=Novosphingobium rosa TaxID=76978 RepID=UPI000832A7E9|nr:ATP-binding protein [Novosphingobium rosa]